MTKVVSIQYPSGGFGHFIHVILSAYCEKFAGAASDYSFGPGGDSHAYPCLLPKYFNSQYNLKAYKNVLSDLQDEFATVLIDSGIDNDSDEYKLIIKPDLTIRICYDDWSWPLLAKMFYTRCMSAISNQKQSIDEWIKPSSDGWSDLNQNWAKREKYFLYLRDHHFRNFWRSDQRNSLNLPVEHILNYKTLHKSLSQIFPVKDFTNFYSSWFQQNQEHFNFYFTALDVIDNLHHDKDISDVTDLFTQAVVYYYIWLRFGFEVPHNDYSNWFTTTKDIVTMLRNHGVDIDSL